MGSANKKKISTDKLFYKIGEVSEIAKIEPYVLRYWESEFPFLKPRKGSNGQRLYTRKDVELVLQIKNLLYNEGYTIAGVRKKFGSSELKKNAVSLETIQGVKRRLKDILNTLSRDIVSYKPQESVNKTRNSHLQM